jgi:hypothetical protein
MRRLRRVEKGEQAMAEDRFLGDRKKALEDEFFQRQEKQLIEDLRKQAERVETRRELADVSGIEDEAVLDRLLAMGISARTLAPLSLVPMVVVAWADGALDTKEREAVLSAAREAGIDTSSPGYALLEDWLRSKPSPQLHQLWLDYTRLISQSMPAEDREALKQELLGRARRVAEAAGGFLGLGRKVSAAEERVLAELARAFD